MLAGLARVVLFLVPLAAGVGNSETPRRPAFSEKGNIMASISNDPGGRRRILFVDKDNERKSIRLGKVAKRLAEEIKTRVETINGAIIAGHALNGDTAAWLGKIAPPYIPSWSMRDWPAREEKGKACLGEFLDAFLERRANAKPNSLKNYRQAAAKLWDHFGRSVELGKISPGMAEAWSLVLAEKHSKAYAGRLVKFARQFFNVAIREKMVVENPFADIKAAAQTNESRKFFVTAEASTSILDACPDAEWRLIFALARYGGLLPFGSVDPTLERCEMGQRQDACPCSQDGTP